MKRNNVGWLSVALLSVPSLCIPVVSGFLLSGLFTLPALAEEYASSERSQAALGHYSRARAMLVEALAEFEEGRRIARPDMVLDAEEWRLSIVSRTEELNRVLDPQPKITKSGVRFKAVGRMIRREADRLPSVPDGARDASTYGEEQRAAELEAARGDTSLEATQKAPLDQQGSVVEEKSVEEEPATPEAKSEDVKVDSTISRYDQEIQKLLDTQEPTTAAAPSAPAAPAAAMVPPVGTDNAAKASVVKQATPEEENSELSDAIEQAIRKRLREAEANGNAPTETLE